MDKGHYTTMMEALAQVPDPRYKRGVRHSWTLILGLIVAAMVSGHKHGRAIAQWVQEHSESLTQWLEPPQGGLPSESTLRRAWRDLDIDALEQRSREYTQGLGQPVPAAKPLVGQSLDGKQVRGAGMHGRSIHLLSVARHEAGVVIAQAQVAAKTNEIGAAPALLAGLDLRGTVTTMDAMLTQRGLARQILAQGGHYLMVVKDNQPQLHEAIAELFEVNAWMPSEIGTRYWRHPTANKGHGRLESRVLESSTVLDGWLDWPGVGQVLRRSCERVIMATGEIEREISYGVTDLSPKLASVAQLETYWRGHWGIENKSHHVRDVTLGEDAGQAYTGSTPEAMAALRNCILGLLRHKGWKSIADALRHYGAYPDRALHLIGALPTRL